VRALCQPDLETRQQQEIWRASTEKHATVEVAPSSQEQTPLIASSRRLSATCLQTGTTQDSVKRIGYQQPEKRQDGAVRSSPTNALKPKPPVQSRARSMDSPNDVPRGRPEALEIIYLPSSNTLANGNPRSKFKRVPTDARFRSKSDLQHSTSPSCRLTAYLVVTAQCTENRSGAYQL
jgi:hypothetical protein